MTRTRANSINVRLPHAAAALVRILSAFDKCSLNCWIARAVEMRLGVEAARLKRLAPLHAAVARVADAASFDVVGPQPSRHPNTVDSPFGEFHP